MNSEQTKTRFDQIVSSLAFTMDQFGGQNRMHARRVAVIAAALSEKILPEKKDVIFYASLLSDVGVAIFGEHPLEYPYMEEQKRLPHIFEHSITGARIIQKLLFPDDAGVFVRDHHEWYDGSGYPNRKKGEDTPLGAQIIRIADSIDQMMKIHETGQFSDIYNYLRLNKGREFNPILWNAIMDLKCKDAGMFFKRVFDNNYTEWVFSEAIQTVNPYWVSSTSLTDDSMKAILETFSEVIDAKYKHLGKHSKRVSLFSEKIARAMELPQDEIKKIQYAAYLHDIGKIYVPSEILDKTGYLSDREKEIMRRYSIITMEVLDTVEVFRDFVDIAGFHHERYDGKGYPDRLSGDDIPMGARILHIADAVDAMLSDRAYRAALSVENTVIQLQRCSGTQFDPLMASIAVGLLDDREILEEMGAMGWHCGESSPGTMRMAGSKRYGVL